MYAVGRLGSYITRSVYTVSGPFHPFGGAVDIIVVEQPDGSFKSSPWYVRFGKFQGVLKMKEKVISINVNGVDADFHMYLDHKGEAYFLKEVEVEEGDDSVIYPSSSGEDTDGKQSTDRQPVKSKSLDYDARDRNSGDQIDVNNGLVVARTSSRRARLFGLVFGRKSITEKKFQGEEIDPGVERTTSLERAELAADLLEAEWSTNLATKRPRKDMASRFSAADVVVGGEADTNLQSSTAQVQLIPTVQDSVGNDLDQQVQRDGTSFQESKCSVEEPGVQVSSTPNEAHEISTSEGSTKLGACPNKQLGDGEVLDERDVLSSHEVSDETGTDKVLSFVYCETSESSRLGLHNFDDQTPETLYLSHGQYEDVPFHGKILHETTENLSEVNSLPVSGILLADESSINVDYLRNGDNERVAESEVTSVNSSGHNIVTESLSSVDIHLITSNSVELETEVLGVIHQDTLIDTNADDINTDTEVVEIPGNHSQRTNSCTSCVLVYDDVEPVGPPMVLQCSTSTVGLAHHVQDEKNIREENDASEVQLCQGVSISSSVSSEEGQFPFSDIDYLKLTEVQCAESSYPVSVDKINIPSLTLEVPEAVNVSSNANCESHSSSEKCVQENLPILGQISSPIVIPGKHEVVFERGGRMVESLPIMWSHVDDLGAHDLRRPYHSLDSGTKSSKWRFLRNNVSSFIKSDEVHQLAGGQPTTHGTQMPGELNDVPDYPAVGSNGTRSSDADALESTTDMGGDKIKLKPRFTKKKVRSIAPTSEQLASLNLKEGRNTVTFTFSTAMLGKQQVDARIYLWKWNTRIVISDVDGTITKSDVLGQFMPLVGVDWSQTGVAHLFSAIKENGYQLIFLSARSISQAYITRQFLCNLKQDGKALPDGPVVISPDGLFPSLFREVIRRAPHEFKISCLEDIKILFPPDCNPFYAGFGNRDTDEFSYLKVGIPKGKIFIINPKGEVVVNRQVDTKSYPSIHALVNGMFPTISPTTEQEDFNTWNYWKLSPPILDL